MAKSNNIEALPRNIISSGTTIKGEIESNGDFRVEGKLTGTIRVKGKIVIGASGDVDGEIHCANADIEGKVKAQVHVKELLALKQTAQLTGDVTTGKLSIEPGARFSGTCNMGDSNIKGSFTDERNQKAK